MGCGKKAGKLRVGGGGGRSLEYEILKICTRLPGLGDNLRGNNSSAGFIYIWGISRVIYQN